MFVYYEKNLYFGHIMRMIHRQHGKCSKNTYSVDTVIKELGALQFVLDDELWKSDEQLNSLNGKVRP